jgi:sugar phosphate isomerase/epimerase
MYVGMITNSLVQAGVNDLEVIADWAAEHGFKELEVGPSAPLDIHVLDKIMEKGRVRIGALLYCRNFLLPDDGPLFREQLFKRIEIAGKLGIKKIVTSTGIDRGWDWAEKFDPYDGIRKRPIRSMDQIVELFKTVMDAAEKNDLKICLETCPLMGNIAISPYLLDELFRRIQSDQLGIAFDPSHFVWEMMDPYAPILRFGKQGKIFHVHGKDTEIDRQRLNETGILSDYSWWRYRIPGLGEINWNKLVSNLYEIGYDGVISMEHEDPVWEGSEEKVKRGLLIGKHTIEKAIHMEK